MSYDCFLITGNTYSPLSSLCGQVSYVLYFSAICCYEIIIKGRYLLNFVCNWISKIRNSAASYCLADSDRLKRGPTLSCSFLMTQLRSWPWFRKTCGTSWWPKSKGRRIIASDGGRGKGSEVPGKYSPPQIWARPFLQREGSNFVNSERISEIRNSAESYCLADSDRLKSGSRYRVVF